MREPEESKESDGFGLGKSARLEAKRAAGLDRLPEHLDPPFPYSVISLDPDTLTGIFLPRFSLKSQRTKQNQASACQSP